MRISYEMRMKQRLAIAKSGRYLVKAAIFLGVAGFVINTFFANATRIGLALAGFAAITAPFGAILTILFSRIGWSKNLLIDFFFNQVSLILVTTGFLTICLYIGFFVICDKNHSFLLIASIASLTSSVILMALGLQFSTINE